jgi:hypothetical protein
MTADYADYAILTSGVIFIGAKMVKLGEEVEVDGIIGVCTLSDGVDDFCHKCVFWGREDCYGIGCASFNREDENDVYFPEKVK